MTSNSLRLSRICPTCCSRCERNMLISPAELTSESSKSALTRMCCEPAGSVLVTSGSGAGMTTSGISCSLSGLASVLTGSSVLVLVSTSGSTSGSTSTSTSGSASACTGAAVRESICSLNRLRASPACGITPWLACWVQLLSRSQPCSSISIAVSDGDSVWPAILSSKVSIE